MIDTLRRRDSKILVTSCIWKNSNERLVCLTRGIETIPRSFDDDRHKDGKTKFQMGVISFILVMYVVILSSTSTLTGLYTLFPVKSIQYDGNQMNEKTINKQQRTVYGKNSRQY